MRNADPAPTRFTTIVFELEGVLHDEYHAVRSALRTCAFHDRFLRRLDAAETTAAVHAAWATRQRERPGESTVERAAAAVPDADPRLFALAFEANARSVPSAGVTLGRLLEAGCRCAIASRQPRDVVRATIETIGFGALPLPVVTHGRPAGALLVTSAVDGVDRSGPVVSYVPVAAGDLDQEVGVVRRLVDVVPLVGVQTSEVVRVEAGPSRVTGFGFSAVTIPDHCVHLTPSGVGELVGHGADALSDAAAGDWSACVAAIARALHRIARMSTLLDEDALRFVGPALEGLDLLRPPRSRPVLEVGEHVVRAHVPEIPLGPIASDASLDSLLDALLAAFDLLSQDAPRAACRRLALQLTALSHRTAGGSPGLVAGEGVDADV